MNTSTLATNLDALTLDQLDTVSGGDFWSKVRPAHLFGSPGTSPPPSHITDIPSLRPPLDPGFEPGFPARPHCPDPEPWQLVPAALSQQR